MYFAIAAVHIACAVGVAAAIAADVEAVAVVTLFVIRVDDFVATSRCEIRAAEAATSVLASVVAVVANFASRDDAVAATRPLALARAEVVVRCIAIVAILAWVEIAVAASRKVTCFLATIGLVAIRGGSRGIALFVCIELAIATCRNFAVGGTPGFVIFGIFAAFAFFDLAIAAPGQERASLGASRRVL